MQCILVFPHHCADYFAHLCQQTEKALKASYQVAELVAKSKPNLVISEWRTK